MFRDAILLSLGVVAFTTLSNATNIIVDYGQANPCTIIVTPSTAINVNPATGNWHTTGIFGADCPNAQLAVPSFANGYGLSGPGPATTNIPFSLTWRADADYCRATDSAATGWPSGSNTNLCGTGSNPPMNCGVAATQTVSVTATTAGTYNFGINCFKNGNNTPVSSSTSVVVNAPAAIPTVSAISGPTSTTVNTQFTLSWTADADYCTTAGSSGTSMVPSWPTGNICTTPATCTNGSINLTANSIGTPTFALACYKGGNGPATASKTVTIDPAPSASCAPAGISPQNSISLWIESSGVTKTISAPLTYLKIFSDGTTPWPGNHLGTGHKISSLGKNQYLSIPFTIPTGTAPNTAIEYKIQESNTGAFTALTVSTCPGEFNTANLGSGCYVNATKTTGMAVIVDATIPSPYCKLQAGNNIYYLNVLQASLSSPATSHCTSSTCTASILPSQK